MDALLSTTGSLVEIYLRGASGTDGDVNFAGGPDAVEQIMKRAPLMTQHVEYIHRDLVYSYDLANDAQKVYRRSIVEELLAGKYHGIVYAEETLPTHRFPCVPEVTHRREIIRWSWRINNRMYLVLDREEAIDVLYVRYNTASNADLDVMKKDLDKILNRLGRL